MRLSALQHRLALLLPLLLLGYGVIANVQHLIGRPWLQPGAVQLLAALLLIPLLLLAPQRVPRLPAIPLLLLALISAVLVLAQALVAGRTLPDALSNALAGSVPPLVLLAALALYQRGTPRRPDWTLPLIVLAALGLGIAQWGLRDPLVWLGDNGRSWMPLIWQGDYIAPGQFVVRAFSIFSSPVQYGVVAVGAALLGFARLASDHQGRVWAALLAALGTVSVIASLNRTAMLGLLAGLLMMWALRPGLSRRAAPVRRRHRLRLPRLRLSGGVKRLNISPAWLTVVPAVITVAALVGPGMAEWAVRQGIVPQQAARTLIIRLQDYPMALTRALGSAEQVMVGSADFAAVTALEGTRADGVKSLPLDNELLYLLVRYGVWGPVLMLLVLGSLAVWAHREWQRTGDAALLAVMGMLAAWSLSQTANVVYSHELPVLAVLILLARRRA